MSEICHWPSTRWICKNKKIQSGQESKKEKNNNNKNMKKKRRRWAMYIQYSVHIKRRGKRVYSGDLRRTLLSLEFATGRGLRGSDLATTWLGHSSTCRALSCAIVWLSTGPALPCPALFCLVRPPRGFMCLMSCTILCLMYCLMDGPRNYGN